MSTLDANAVAESNPEAVLALGAELTEARVVRVGDMAAVRRLLPLRLRLRRGGVVLCGSPAAQRGRAHVHALGQGLPG